MGQMFSRLANDRGEPAVIPGFLRPIDTKAIAKELQLSEKGTERGKEDLPRSDEHIWDAVEQTIGQKIESEWSWQGDALIKTLRAYADRLIGFSVSAIRLCGIDAPEQRCSGYAEARAALRTIVEGKAVRCIQVGEGTPCDGRSKPTNRERVVAQCFVEGTDIAAGLVKQGLVCDWRRFSGGYYSRDGKGRQCPNNHRATCTAVLAPDKDGR
jgi:hypothetical protein